MPGMTSSPHADGRRRSSIKRSERRPHSAWTGKPGLCGNQRHRQIGVIEQALGTVDAQRLRDLKRGCFKMLGK
jgi:hypothetical protein